MSSSGGASASASACPHPIIYQGLCASCGSDVTQAARQQPLRRGTVGGAADANAAIASSSPSSLLSASASASGAPSSTQAVVLGGLHRTIHLTPQALQDQSRRNSLSLLRSRRLLCVLDLDHTLLHATSDPRVADFVGREEDLFTVTLPQPRPLPPKMHFVKLRPGLSAFLAVVSSLFELHVYTMGVRPYADAVVPLMDPEGRYIAQRIVSRDETGGGEGVAAAQVAKSLKRMYPCDASLICIVDDRTDVWRDQATNVLRAYEFMYFSGSKGEMNARPGQQHGRREQGQGQAHASVLPTHILPPIRSKPHTLTPPAAAAVASAAPSAPAAAASTPGTTAPAKSSAPTTAPSPTTTTAVKPVTASPAAVAASTTTPSTPAPSATTAAPPAATSSRSSGSKIRRRKAATVATPIEMQPPTRAPYVPAATVTAPTHAPAAATADDPIVLDADPVDAKAGTPAATATATPAQLSGASAPATAVDEAKTDTSSSPSTDSPVRMDIDGEPAATNPSRTPQSGADALDDDEDDADSRMQRELDRAIDLTHERDAEIDEAKRAARLARSPYDADPASLPIFPYQFCSHPHPDNVLISLTAVLQAAHTLFYEHTDAAVREQLDYNQAAKSRAEESADADPPATSRSGSPLSVTSASTPSAALSDLLPLSPSHSIPRLLGLLKRTTLAGCVLVFSGVFPTVKPAPGATFRGSGAQRADAWIQATAFGATCLEEFPEVEEERRKKERKEKRIAEGATEDVEDEEDAPVVPFGQSLAAAGVAAASGSACSTPLPRPPLRVTHVVAARDGSAKTHHARSLPADRRPFLVHVSWLWHSLAHFQRGDEAKFPLWPEGGKGAATSAHRTPSPTATASAPASTAGQGASDAASPAPAVAATSGADALAETPTQTAPDGTTTPDGPTPAAASSTPVAADAVAGVPTPAADAAPTTVASTSVPAASATAEAPASTAPSAATPAPAAAASSSAAAPPSSSGAAPIRRRVPKKQPALAAPAAADAGAATHTPAATASVAPVAAPSTPATTVPSSAAASSALSSSSSSPTDALPAPGTLGLHLVHHVSRPPTVDALVARVRAYLAQEADESNRSRAEAEVTQAREMVKAQQLRRAMRARRSQEGGGSGDAGIGDAAAAASDGSAVAAAAASSISRPSHRKSVSFSSRELGPTNPHFSDAGEAHTEPDVGGASMGSSAAAGSLKRKLHPSASAAAADADAGLLPLDDVARAKKERRQAHGGSSVEAYGDDGAESASDALPSAAELYAERDVDERMHMGGMGDEYDPDEDAFADVHEGLLDELDPPDDDEEGGRFDDDL